MEKRILLLLLLFCGFKVHCKAQTTKITTTSHGFNAFDNKVVKDSTGAVIPLEQWHKIFTTGQYRLQGLPNNADTMLLIKMSDAELEAMDTRMPAPPASPAFPLGTSFSMFKDRDIDGKKIDPKELAGKIIVLNFWFIACPPCKAEIPELNKLMAIYYNNPNVVFIAVCLDQRWNIKDFLKEIPFNYRQVADGRDTSNQYGVSSYPTNVVIDKKGMVRFSSMGYGRGTLTWLKKTLTQINSEN